MVALISVAGWFVAGRSWFTNIVAALGISTLAATGGYLAGRVHGSAAAELHNLRVQMDIMAAEIARHEFTAKEAARLAAEAADAEKRNEQVRSEIDAREADAPVIPGCTTGDFLERLRRLR